MWGNDYPHAESTFPRLCGSSGGDSRASPARSFGCSRATTSLRCTPSQFQPTCRRHRRAERGDRHRRLGVPRGHAMARRIAVALRHPPPPGARACSRMGTRRSSSMWAIGLRDSASHRTALCTSSRCSPPHARGPRGVARPFADLTAFSDKFANDMITDGAGRSYVGCRNVGELGAPLTASSSSMLRRGSVAADDLVTPNGVVVSPGMSTLVVAETHVNRLTAFDVGIDGGPRTGGCSQMSTAPPTASASTKRVAYGPRSRRSRPLFASSTGARSPGTSMCPTCGPSTRVLGGRGPPHAVRGGWPFRPWRTSHAWVSTGISTTRASRVASYSAHSWVDVPGAGWP